ncbi:MAG TPA: hypothetical protein VGB20_01230 [bacterium]
MRRNSGAWRAGLRLALAAALGAGAGGAAGCESMQRKFTRKPTKPAERPAPVIGFLDYSRATTPLERYQKHYLIFSYWHAELLAALDDVPASAKRLRRTSEESLGELGTMQELLTGEAAAQLAALIEERSRIDRELQHSAAPSARLPMLRRMLEAQSRRIEREFYWREVESMLAPADAEAQAAPPAE